MDDKHPTAPILVRGEPVVLGNFFIVTLGAHTIIFITVFKIVILLHTDQGHTTPIPVLGRRKLPPVPVWKRMLFAMLPIIFAPFNIDAADAN